jgi:hypothetical protein
LDESDTGEHGQYAAFCSALVELCTSTRARRHFFRAGHRAELPALAPGARNALESIGEASLERAAKDLLAKRRTEFEEIVPLSLCVCPSLGQRYARHLADHPASPSDGVLSPGAAEAMRFLDVLYAELCGDDGEVAYAADLFAFEVLRAAARRDQSRRRLRVRFDVPSIARDVKAGLLPTAPEPVDALLEFGVQGVRVLSP